MELLKKLKKLPKSILKGAKNFKKLLFSNNFLKLKSELIISFGKLFTDELLHFLHFSYFRLLGCLCCNQGCETYTVFVALNFSIIIETDFYFVINVGVTIYKVK